MSATPPEAKPEYSRAPRQSKAPAAFPGPVSRAVLAGGAIGALLLLVAEFTPLYKLNSASSRIPPHAVDTGSHQHYALIPVGVLALVLAVGAFRSASRAALLAIGALGILTVLVALIGDLPDASASGFAAGFTQAKDIPQIGLYLETLGAAVLVITCVAGLVLTRPPSAPAAK